MKQLIRLLDYEVFDNLRIEHVKESKIDSFTIDELSCVINIFSWDNKKEEALHHLVTNVDSKYRKELYILLREQCSKVIEWFHWTDSKKYVETFLKIL